MRINDFAMVKDFANVDVDYDDCALVEMIEKIKKDIENRRNDLEIKNSKCDRFDYLSITVARLAYEFAKEEYNALFFEAKKRGLV